MNILLFLPGLLVVLFQYRGVIGTVESAAIIASVQLLLPAPFFFTSAPLARAYFSSAFDFSRQFLYEWTVNWRFVPQPQFHSQQFASSLLGLQLVFLVAFAWYRWSPVPGGTFGVLKRGLQFPFQPSVTAIQLPSHRECPMLVKY